MRPSERLVILPSSPADASHSQGSIRWFDIGFDFAGLLREPPLPQQLSWIDAISR
jgi:hypothetical protein